MKKGFTLIELITVLIIVAVLAALALPQFAKMVERARGAEANVAIGIIRNIVMAYYSEGKGMFTIWEGNDQNKVYLYNQTGLPICQNYGNNINVCTDPNHYFQYSVGIRGIPANPPAVRIIAWRCRQGGKNPTGRPPANEWGLYMDVYPYLGTCGNIKPLTGSPY